MRPEVLILDEPTAGLDPRGRAEIIGNIMNYKRAHNATVVMVTHSMEEIARNVDRIIIFENGGVVMGGTPASVFSESERLASMGLSAPKATLVAHRLLAMGLPISRDIYTIPQLRMALGELRGGGQSA
jgi:energy-coupling factor transport system ATP-binding protein